MEPRNVMLEKKKKKIMEEKEAVVKHERGKNVAAKLTNLLESKSADGGLLCAIASFLERHGFSKALLALQSEAQGVIDNSLADAIKLEYVYYKYMKDGCALSSDGRSSGLKEKDSRCGLQINGGKSEVVASKEVNDKKRRNNGDMLNFYGPEVDNSDAAVLGHLSEMRPACKKKKEKKHRKTSDGPNAEDTRQFENEKSGKFGNLGNALENVKPVSTGVDGKSKDTTLPAEPTLGKKKKNKSCTSQEEDASQNHGEASMEKSAETFNEHPTPEVVNVNSLNGLSYTVSLSQICTGYKNKKKTNKSTSDGLHCENGKTEDCLHLEGVVSTNKDGAKMVCDKAAKHDTDVRPHHSLATSKEAKRKRKSIVEDLQYVESKDICSLTSHEDASGDGETMVKEEAHNLNSKDAEFAEVKKRKKFKDLVNESVQPCIQVSERSKKSVKMPEPKQCLKSNMEGNPEAVNISNVSKVHANGYIEDKELGGCTAETHEKGSKRSAVKTNVNAFRRVNLDDITFIDDRLQDNSYWAKSGAESGYGAKAQEVLGQVRGKDFRHEKTKKKRGSYRGGLIDLQSHSIKFSYSDDE